MYSISWGCPKIVHQSDPVSLLISTFSIHLEPGCKSHGQIIYYCTANNVQKQATVFLYFQTESHNLTRKVFPIVWPQCCLDYSGDTLVRKWAEDTLSCLWQPGDACSSPVAPPGTGRREARQCTRTFSPGPAGPLPGAADRSEEDCGPVLVVPALCRPQRKPESAVPTVVCLEQINQKPNQTTFM